MLYPQGMTALAQRLDDRLRTLSPAKAASVEKLVIDLLDIVDEPAPLLDRAGAIAAHQAHIIKCLDLAAELDWTDFERPSQGVDEIREDW
jgi:hypothetical protein